MNDFFANIDPKRYKDIQHGCLAATRRSMERWCQLFGVPMEEVMTEIERGRRMMILSTGQIKVGERYQEFVDAYYEDIKGLDFWQVTDYHHRNHVSDAYEALETVFGEKLIEESYIFYLGKMLGMDPTQYSSFYTFVSEFSRYVPHIYLYDYEFNAFLNGKSEINGFPAIVFEQTLYGVMQNMATIIVRNLFERVEKNGKVYVHGYLPEQIKAASENAFVTIGLGVNLDVLTGRKLFSAINLTPKPGVEGLVDIVVDLVVKYITLHEYGHLYRGHLVSEHPVRDLEFDADYFAIAALSRFAFKKQVNSYLYNLAVTIVFSRFHFRETILGIKNPNYPSAMDRFNYVVSLMNNRDEHNTPPKFFEKIRLLAAPTIARQFGIDI